MLLRMEREKKSLKELTLSLTTTGWTTSFVLLGDCGVAALVAGVFAPLVLQRKSQFFFKVLVASLLYSNEETC